MQPSARPRRPTRCSQARQLHRNEDDEDDDDQAVAQQQCQDNGRGRNDGSEAGENEERRQSEDESSADDDNSKAASRPAVVQKRRPPRVDSRCASQISEPKARETFAQSRICNGGVFSVSVAKSHRCCSTATLQLASRETTHVCKRNRALFWGQNAFRAKMRAKTASRKELG